MVTINISVSFLFRAASLFSRITLKAILPTFSQSFWSEIRNKPHVSINHLPKQKNDWAGHHWSTQTAQITLWTPSFLIIHCVKLAFNCRKGCWDFLSLTSFLLDPGPTIVLPCHSGVYCPCQLLPNRTKQNFYTFFSWRLKCTHMTADYQLERHNKCDRNDNSETRQAVMTGTAGVKGVNKKTS